MYAIFRAQGKQFRAVEDAVLRIPTLEAEPGDTVTFDDVLLAEREGDIHIGAPSLKGASVAVEVLGHGRGEKIVVYKMKRRKGYRRKQGHRQGYTEIRVVGIELPKGKPKRPEVKAAPAKKEAAKAAPAAREALAETPVADEPAVEAADEPVVEAAADEPAAPGTADFDITDAARELAEAHGLDLTAIEGSGKEGRILKSDVDKAIKAKEGD